MLIFKMSHSKKFGCNGVINVLPAIITPLIEFTSNFFQIDSPIRLGRTPLADGSNITKFSPQFMFIAPPSIFDSQSISIRDSSRKLLEPTYNELITFPRIKKYKNPFQILDVIPSLPTSWLTPTPNNDKLSANYLSPDTFIRSSSIEDMFLVAKMENILSKYNYNPSCATNELVCDNVCTPIDQNNCGACGIVCPISTTPMPIQCPYTSCGFDTSLDCVATLANSLGDYSNWTLFYNGRHYAYLSASTSRLGTIPVSGVLKDEDGKIVIQYTFNNGNPSFQRNTQYPVDAILASTTTSDTISGIDGYFIFDKTLNKYVYQGTKQAFIYPEC